MLFLLVWKQKMLTSYNNDYNLLHMMYNLQKGHTFMWV